MRRTFWDAWNRWVAGSWYTRVTILREKGYACTVRSYKHSPQELIMKWLLRNISLFKNWPEIYRGKTLLILRNGLQFSVFSRQDIPTLYEILVEKVYDPLFSGLKTPPRVILDVGANIGIFSVVVKKRFPDASVYAFEASLENTKKLKENAVLNSTSIHGIHKAVSGNDKERVLFFSDTSGKHSLLGEGVGERVECETLDSIISTYGPIDLVKIDIEGSEIEVLNASQRLSEINRIAIEFHNNQAEVLPILLSNGFVPISVITHGVQVFGREKRTEVEMS